MAVKIGSARIDENGKAKGGKAGDQTGREVSTQNWYEHSKGWRVFRAKDPAVAEKIAQDMQWACDNKHIGYDQGQRLSLYDVAKPLGFNCKKVTTNCETDCSALVRVCCAYAGVTLPNFRTPTEPAALLDSGAFVELKGSRYTEGSAWLKRGDILVTRSQGHTVVVLTDGSKAGKEDDTSSGAVAPPSPQGEGMVNRTLKVGCEGVDVKAMQRLLLKWDAGCLPDCGADGEFGSETKKAVKAFQKAAGLPVTGVYDADTKKALVAATAGYIRITGNSVYVRAKPGRDGEALGTVHIGDRLPWQGKTAQAEGRDWYLILYENRDGWVSSKYAEPAEE